MSTQTLPPQSTPGQTQQIVSPAPVADAQQMQTSTVTGAPIDSHNGIAVNLSQPNPGSTTTVVGAAPATGVHTTSTLANTPEQVLLEYVSEVRDQMRIPDSVQINSVVDLFSPAVLNSLSKEKRRDVKNLLNQIMNKLVEVAKDRSVDAKDTSDAAMKVLFTLATTPDSVRPDQPIVNHTGPEKPLAMFIGAEAGDNLFSVVKDQQWWHGPDNMNAKEKVAARQEKLAFLTPILLDLAKHDPEGMAAKAVSFLTSSYENNASRDRVDLALNIASTALATKPEHALRGILHSVYRGSGRIFGSDNSEQVTDNLQRLEALVSPLQQRPEFAGVVGQIQHEINNSRSEINGHKMVTELDAATTVTAAASVVAPQQQPQGGDTVALPAANQTYNVTM